MNKDEAQSKKKELETKEIKPQNVYVDYKKCMTLMEKASSIKDTKTLNQLYSQINNFRKNFTKNDYTYIYEFLTKKELKLNFSFLDSQTKEALHHSFNFNSKYVSKLREEVLEVNFFNSLLLILSQIDENRHQESFESLENLVILFSKNKSYTVNYLKAKTYYYYCLEAERLDKNTYLKAHK